MLHRHVLGLVLKQRELWPITVMALMRTCRRLWDQDARDGPRVRDARRRWWFRRIMAFRIKGFNRDLDRRHNLKKIAAFWSEAEFEDLWRMYSTCAYCGYLLQLRSSAHSCLWSVMREQKNEIFTVDDMEFFHYQVTSYSCKCGVEFCNSNTGPFFDLPEFIEHENVCDFTFQGRFCF